MVAGVATVQQEILITLTQRTEIDMALIVNTLKGGTRHTIDATGNTLQFPMCVCK